MPSLPRRAAHRLVSAVMPRVPLAAYLRLTPRNPVGFFYHVVSNEALPHIQRLFPYKSTAEFEADLLWLTHHTEPVGYDHLLTHRREQRRLPPSASHLSFDDGLVECFTVIRPLLLKYGIPATFFLTTDWIDNRGLFFRSKVSLIIDTFERLPRDEQAHAIRRIADRFGVEKNLDAVLYWLKGLPQSEEPAIDQVCGITGVDPEAFLAERRPYLTTEQILSMQAEGFAFGAHSRRHAKLAGLTPEDQAAEIVESCRIVARLTGQEQVPFAFPFSGDRVSRPMLSDLQRRHPEIGLIFDTRKLRREPDVVHRIWSDRTAPNVPHGRNLEYWLHDAYRRDMAERALG